MGPDVPRLPFDEDPSFLRDDGCRRNLERLGGDPALEAAEATGRDRPARARAVGGFDLQPAPNLAQSAHVPVREALG